MSDPKNTQPAELRIVQSEGRDGRYSKLKLRLGSRRVTIDLTMEQLGQAVAGVTVVTVADVC